MEYPEVFSLCIKEDPEVLSLSLCKEENIEVLFM